MDEHVGQENPEGSTKGSGKLIPLDMLDGGCKTVAQDKPWPVDLSVLV